MNYTLSKTTDINGLIQTSIKIGDQPPILIQTRIFTEIQNDQYFKDSKTINRKIISTIRQEARQTQIFSKDFPDLPPTHGEALGIHDEIIRHPENIEQIIKFFSAQD